MLKRGTMATTTIPKNLSELLHVVFATPSEKPRVNVLIDTLRKYKFWPALQVKMFHGQRELVLLHNTYKREDTQHFQQLYDESRSVVLNMSAPEGENIVVTYAASIPERMNDVEYESDTRIDDTVEMAYEGTTVTVYHHNGVWYFGTTSCPTVDSSRYFHPTKTHGRMFDEAVSNIMNEPVPTSRETSRELRNKFAERLDTSKAYAFLLVHHENKHVMDYTEVAGEKYAFLVHISTRDRTTHSDCSQDTVIPSIIYTKVYDTPQAGLQELRTNNSVYALIIKRPDNKTLKVSKQEVINHEEKDLGNPNVWLNMLNVYIKNRADYKIVDYQKEFAPDLEVPKTSRGRDLAPTYLIHTVICNMRDILYAAYNMTTGYNPQTKMYRINKELDALYSPIVRFHLAQLRNLQATVHSHSLLSAHFVYNYICHRQTLKNLRLFVKHFATVCHDAMNGYMAVPYGMPFHVAECFVILDNLLSA